MRDLVWVQERIPQRYTSIYRERLDYVFKNMMTSLNFASNITGETYIRPFSEHENLPLLESSRVNVSNNVSSNVSAMSHSRHSYNECLGNVLNYI